MISSTLSRPAVGDVLVFKTLETIQKKSASLPDREMKWTHLQFRRYAGCPVCNLHLRSVSQRISEIETAGIREIAIFHSSVKEMLRYQSNLPFAVIADPEKKLYREFGVESSPTALLNPKVWGAIATGITQFAPATVAEGGKNGLPADFLIDATGRIAASHYGTHANDQWSVDELLALARTH